MKPKRPLSWYSSIISLRLFSYSVSLYYAVNKSYEYKYYFPHAEHLTDEKIEQADERSDLSDRPKEALQPHGCRAIKTTLYL
jgi:hypothetical protein